MSSDTPRMSTSGIAINRHLRAESSSVGAARGALRPLEGAIEPNTFETLRLLVSELVTNSVRHADLAAEKTIELHVDASRERIRVEVSDDGAGFAAAGGTDHAGSESGWGLRLVESLSDRWGVEGNGRMSVWFELVDSGAFVFPRSTD